MANHGHGHETTSASMTARSIRPSICATLTKVFLSQAIATAYPQFLVAKAQKIVGVAVGNRKEAIETLQFAERGLVKTHFTTAKPEELTSIFERMDKGEISGRVILDLS